MEQSSQRKSRYIVHRYPRLEPGTQNNRFWKLVARDLRNRLCVRIEYLNVGAVRNGKRWLYWFNRKLAKEGGPSLLVAQRGLAHYVVPE